MQFSIYTFTTILGIIFGAYGIGCNNLDIILIGALISYASYLRHKILLLEIDMSVIYDVLESSDEDEN